MAIKTTLRFYLNTIRTATIKNTTTNKCWGGYGAKRNPHTLLVGMCAIQPLWKTIWRLLYKLNIDLPCDPVIPLLGTYWKECQPDYNKGICTPMFIAALYKQ
jgi:hypothetical protein